MQLSFGAGLLLLFTTTAIENTVIFENSAGLSNNRWLNDDESLPVVQFINREYGLVIQEPAA